MAGPRDVIPPTPVAPKPEAADAEILPGSPGEKMLNAFVSGKGCSAIGKIMEDIPVEQRGGILKQAESPYTKTWTYAKDGTLPAVEVRADQEVPFVGKFGHPETMKYFASGTKVNHVKRENAAGKMETIYREAYDSNTKKVLDVVCKDQ